MFPANFGYVAANSVDEALELLAAKAKKGGKAGRMKKAA